MPGWCMLNGLEPARNPISIAVIEDDRRIRQALRVMIEGMDSTVPACMPRWRKRSQDAGRICPRSL